jgi:aminomethyltransferase
MSETTTGGITRADPAAYSAALEGAALYASEARGRIWMRDRDRAALLHRLSTNQIEQLRPGQGTDTVLATPIGRIIDLLSVYALDEALLLVTSPGRGPAIAGHLRKNIFFNDKVKLEDATATLGQLALYGPRAAALLGALGLPGAELPAHGIVMTGWRDQPLYLARTPALDGGLWLIALPAALAELGAALRDAGAHPLDEATHEVLRVEAGQGAYGRELSLEYIPLETGLWHAVSFTKGCYVGQEIIARMESRGRLAKSLRGLRFAEPPPLSPEAHAPVARLDAGGKEAGDLTSIVESPRYGLIGLAYVRTAHAEPGTRLAVAGVAGEVVDLPFKA